MAVSRLCKEVNENGKPEKLKADKAPCGYPAWHRELLIYCLNQEQVCKSIKHITEEAAEWSNIADSLDYELRGKRKKTWAGRWIMAHRDWVIRATQSSILGGTLRPGNYVEKTINERGKERLIQCISLLRSIGIHAVMKVVEKYLDRAFVADTAASIKGRGSHYLLKRVLKDMKRDTSCTRLIYKDDITKFYQNTSQDVLMEVVRKKIRDRRIVRILERWVRMLPTGVSIGMRPSQGLENLLLSVYCDHVTKDTHGFRHYKRYCDDRLVMAGSWHELTRAVKVLQEQTAKAGLNVKHTAQCWQHRHRPVDFLGFVIRNSGQVSIRKATKQRFARRWKRVRSLRRKRELVGSFYGICRHAHARHLFRKLTGITMTQFSDIGFIYQRDGKKDFSQQSISLRQLTNMHVTVLDFETDIKTKEGEGRYIVLIKLENGEEKKFFTNNDKMKKALDFAREKDMIPFDTTIKADGGYGYMFT